MFVCFVFKPILSRFNCYKLRSNMFAYLRLFKSLKLPLIGLYCFSLFCRLILLACLNRLNFFCSVYRACRSFLKNNCSKVWILILFVRIFASNYSFKRSFKY